MTGNLNGAITRMIMANFTPHIEMRAKVVYSDQSSIEVIMKLWIMARH